MYRLSEDYSTFRREYTPIRVRHILGNYHSLYMKVYRWNDEEIHCILIDVMQAFSRIRTTEKEREIMRYYTRGYSLTEIGQIFGFSRSRADSLVRSVSTKIANDLTGSNRYES